MKWHPDVRGQAKLKMQGDELTLRMPPRKTQVIDYDRKFSCPYCLYTAPFQYFLLRHRKKVLQNVKCPDCGLTMHRGTLTRKMSASEYGRWLCQAVYMWRGYERISWEKLFQRLKEKGMATQVWDAYHAEKRGMLTREKIDEDYEAFKRDLEE